MTYCCGVVLVSETLQNKSNAPFATGGQFELSMPGPLFWPTPISHGAFHKEAHLPTVIESDQKKCNAFKCLIGVTILLSLLQCQH